MIESSEIRGQAFCCGVAGNPRAKLDFDYCVSCIHDYLMGDLTIPFHESYFGNTLLLDRRVITQDQLNILMSEKQLLQCFNTSKAAKEAIHLRLESDHATELEKSCYSSTDFKNYMDFMENSTKNMYESLLLGISALRSRLSVILLKQALHGLQFYRCISKGEFKSCANGKKLATREIFFSNTRQLSADSHRKRKLEEIDANDQSTDIIPWVAPNISSLSHEEQVQQQQQHNQEGVQISLIDENKSCLYANDLIQQAVAVGEGLLNEIIRCTYLPRNNFPRQQLKNRKTDEIIDFLMLTPKDTMLYNLPKMPIFRALLSSFVKKSKNEGRNSNETLVLWQIMCALTVLVTKSKSFSALPGAFGIAESILRSGAQDKIDFLSNLGITPPYATYMRWHTALLDSRTLPENWLKHHDIDLKTLPQQRQEILDGNKDDYFDDSDGKYYLFHMSVQMDNYDDTQHKNEATREKTITDSEHGTIVTVRIEPIPYDLTEIYALPSQNFGFPVNLLSLANVSFLQNADGSLNDMETHDRSLGKVSNSIMPYMFSTMGKSIVDEWKFRASSDKSSKRHTARFLTRDEKVREGVNPRRLFKTKVVRIFVNSNLTNTAEAVLPTLKLIYHGIKEWCVGDPLYHICFPIGCDQQITKHITICLSKYGVTEKWLQYFIYLEGIFHRMLLHATMTINELMPDTLAAISAVTTLSAKEEGAKESFQTSDSDLVAGFEVLMRGELMQDFMILYQEEYALFIIANAPASHTSREQWINIEQRIGAAFWEYVKTIDWPELELFLQTANAYFMGYDGIRLRYFTWMTISTRFYDLLYPIVNKYNYNAQAKHLEAIRCYLRVNNYSMGLRQLEYLQLCTGKETMGPAHNIGNDEYLESQAIRDLKMATKQHKQSFTAMTKSFPIDSLIEKLKQSFDLLKSNKNQDFDIFDILAGITDILLDRDQGMASSADRQVVSKTPSWDRYTPSWRESREWKLHAVYLARKGEYVIDRAVDVNLERKRKNPDLQQYLLRVKPTDRIRTDTIPPLVSMNMCDTYDALYIAANSIFDNLEILRNDNMREWGNSFARHAEAVQQDPEKMMGWTVFEVGSTTSAQLRFPTSISMRKTLLIEQNKKQSPSKTSLKLQNKKTSEFIKRLNSMPLEERKRMESMSVMPTCYVINEPKKDPILASPKLHNFLSIVLTDLMLPGPEDNPLKFSSQGIAPKNCPLLRIPANATHVLMTPNDILFTNEVLFKPKTLNVHDALVNLLKFFSSCYNTSKNIKFWYIPFDNIVAIKSNPDYFVNLSIGLVDGVVHKKRLCDNNGKDNYGSSRDQTKFAFNHIVDREYMGFFLVHHFSAIFAELDLEDMRRLAGTTFVFGNIAEFKFAEISRGNGKPPERVYDSHHNNRMHYSVSIGLDMTVEVTAFDSLSGEDESALCIRSMFAKLTQPQSESAGDKLNVHIISHDCETLLALLHHSTVASATADDLGFANMQAFTFEISRMWQQTLLVNNQFMRFLSFSKMFPSAVTSISHKVSLFITICMIFTNKYGPSLSIYSVTSGYNDFLVGVKQYVEYTILHAGRGNPFCFLTTDSEVNIEGVHFLLVFLLARKNMDYSTALNTMGGISNLITDLTTQNLKRPGVIAEFVAENASILNDERTFPPPEALLLHAHRIQMSVAKVNGDARHCNNAIEMQVSKKGKTFKPIMLTAAVGLLLCGLCLIVKKCACKSNECSRRCLCAVSNRQLPVPIPCGIFCLKWFSVLPSEKLSLSPDQAIEVVSVMTSPNFRLGFPKVARSAREEDTMHTEGQDLDREGKDVAVAERKEVTGGGEEKEVVVEEEEEEEDDPAEAAAYEEEQKQEETDMLHLLGSGDEEEITEQKLQALVANLKRTSNISNTDDNEMIEVVEYNDENNLVSHEQYEIMDVDGDDEVDKVGDN